ncbi:MAG: hypothetical protein H6600_04820 [Flavobacteriales bacterium]|nr:hypothetical protein [Flavobacteriales bacterium]MCB9197759.1 hypothetical protein [Flavobacteriales bacterium]
MKTVKTFMLVALAASMAACGNKEDEKTTESDSAQEKKTEESIDVVEDPIDDGSTMPALEPGKFPFDFPVIENTNAVAGDNVFYVNMKLIINDYNEGLTSFGTQYLLGTLSEAGQKESKVAFVGDEIIPNSGIIKIPANESVKVGDIVAGKWAVNMTRAIITDVSNPNEPKACFIGLDYDNPAKAEDGQTGIGQYEYTLKQGEFIKISEAYAPASCCVYKNESGDYKLMNVFRAEGDKVLGTVFTSFEAVPKASCTPIPLKPSYKVGDVVYAPWVGTMSKGKITEVNKKLGRYNVKFDEDYQGESMIAFGEVIDQLP